VVRGSLIWNTLPYVLIAAGIPFLFKLTKDNALDANVGELSYPIYMCHLFVMGWFEWSPLNAVPVLPRHILTIILVIIVAFLLDRLLVLPIDRLRLKFGASPRIHSSTLEPKHAISKRGATLRDNRRSPLSVTSLAVTNNLSGFRDPVLSQILGSI
jgi:peptidoglycan/LPS O-acetylase OafA/YrhL